MKTSTLFIVITLLISGCVWEGENTSGSGKVTRVVHHVSPFGTLNLGVVFHVFLIPSDTAKVVVETDDNLQNLVSVENTDSSLSIKMNRHISISRSTSGKIYVYFKNLHEINNTSVGTLENESVIKSTKLIFNNKAVGKTMLTIEASDVII